MSNHYQEFKQLDSVNKYNLILKKSLPFVDSYRLELIYYTNNANSLKENGDLFESAINYNKALDLIQKDDSTTIFTLINNLSDIYYELDYPDKAKFFIDSARSIISFNDWSVEALNNAGLVYSKTKDYSLAKSCFLRAIKKSDTDENLISLAQSYSNMLETLQPGETWSQFGFTKCITTSVKQKEYIDKVMRGVSYDVIPPIISDVFEKSKLPSKTIVAVHTKEQRDTVNLIKAFYLKYPQFRWITFRDMRGLSEFEFANTLRDCCLSIWMDDESGFGTFPLESMKCGVPVLGKVPNLIPEWLTEDNGIWISEKNAIVDVASDFIQNWLEDNLNPELFDRMNMTVDSIPTKESFEQTTINLFTELFEKRIQSFEDQLSKFETI